MSDGDLSFLETGRSKTGRSDSGQIVFTALSEVWISGVLNHRTKNGFDDGIETVGVRWLSGRRGRLNQLR